MSINFYRFHDRKNRLIKKFKLSIFYQFIDRTVFRYQFLSIEHARHIISGVHAKKTLGNSFGR